MKVFTNLPDTAEDKEELTRLIADFRATLIIEKIKSLNISDVSKKEVLMLLLKKLKEEYIKENV